MKGKVYDTFIKGGKTNTYNIAPNTLLTNSYKLSIVINFAATQKSLLG